MAEGCCIWLIIAIGFVMVVLLEGGLSKIWRWVTKQKCGTTFFGLQQIEHHDMSRVKEAQNSIYLQYNS